MAVRDGIDAHFMWGIRSVRTAKKQQRKQMELL